ncbi:BTB/POZ domain-containing protein 2 [Trachymyrmex zeteki]|uniref:BTB/POZ domain-containing protein 2 n=1 Tax=Mycetomoellerius zeteki TaxID=64791 RepID=A0A151WPU5_9HYME|nr:BTB/POZ domain-containing protein 2 [Trachymyrmex zeteki]
MSTETALNDVSNVASRLQGLRVAHAEDDPSENATAGCSTPGSSTVSSGSAADGSGPSSLREPLRNITLSRARRALNFVGDEDQPLSSSIVRSEASFFNGDNRPPTNAANISYLEGRTQNNATLENSTTQNQPVVMYNWQGTKATMRERIVFLFNNEILSDVTFLVGRGAQQQRIPAHKLVLSCGSAVFDAMFNGTLATASSEIEVPDVEPAAFLAVLLFLYTDEIQIDPETVMTTLYTAKKYAVAALEKHCVDFLKNNLTSDNAFLLLTQARLFDEPQLASVCLDTIDRFTTDAFTADGFTDIDIDTLMIVLERDTLRVRESKLFQAVLRWSEAECVRQQLPVTPENQRLVLGDALSLVRFPLMSKEEFTAGPAQSGYSLHSETLRLNFIGPYSYYGTKGMKTVMVDCDSGSGKVKFKFSSELGDNNGTSTDEGQIPELIFYT